MQGDPGDSRGHDPGRSHLGALDAVAGDGDHGRGMVRGSHAALRAAETAQARDADCGEILLAAGSTWAAEAGGTSGILWGAGLEALGKRLSGLLAITPEHLCAGIRDVYGAVARLGHAERGDKTMLDALEPFNEVLETSINDGRPLAEAWDAAATRARIAAEQTSAMRPQVGRAGHWPNAASAAPIQALCRWLSAWQRSMKRYKRQLRYER